MSALSHEVAAAKRDAGMASAIEHANSETPGWSDLALKFLCEYAATHERFLAEEVVLASSRWFAVPIPPTGKAWGPVLRAAAKAGVIEKAGYGLADTSNRSPKTLWRSKVYEGVRE